MYKKIVPFNPQKFADTKVKPVTNYNFAKEAHIASVLVNEVNRVAPAYPMVFLKEAEDKYGLYALLGFQQGENLYVDADGKWQAPYIPAIIRRYPFALGRGQEENQFVICVDEESDLLSKEEGRPLVEDGKPGEVVEAVKKYLSDIYRFNELTARFCEELRTMDLLHPLNVQLKQAGEEAPAVNIAGCFGVNEKKLNELPDASYLELRKKGALPLVYAHLLSLAQIHRLAELRRARGAA